MNPFLLLSIELTLTFFAVIILLVVILRPRAEESETSDPSVSLTHQDDTIPSVITSIAFLVPLIFIPMLWNQAGYLFNNAFRSDSFSLFFKGLFLISGFFITLISRDYQNRIGKRSSEFFLLLITAVLGASFLVSANDFLTFFISLELLTISAYVLSAYQRTSARALEAAGKYLIMGAFSSAVLLFGIAFIYGNFGSVSFELIQQTIRSEFDIAFSAYFGFFLVLAGLGFKISAFPFQLWAPDVYEGSPTPLTAFLAIISKGAGFAVLIKLAFGVFALVRLEFTLLFSLLASATLLYGNLGAIPQIGGNIKRLLAFSGISHAGYLLIGVASGSSLGVAAILYYLTAYAVATLILFFVIAQLAPNESVPSFKGLFGRNFLLGSVLFIALLSLAGVPPLGGFFAKYMIIQSAVGQNLLSLAILGALNIMISLYYYLMVIKTMYVDSANSNAETISLSLTSKVSVAALTLVLIGLGLFQAPFLDLIAQALS